MKFFGENGDGGWEIEKMFEKFPQMLWLNDTKLSISDY